MGVRYGEGVSPLPIGERSGGSAPSPIFFNFGGLEMRILVHSLALLSADCIVAFAHYFTVQMQLALTRYVNAPTLSRTILLHNNNV